MKKNILIFGIISGALISAFTTCSMAWCYHSENFSGNMFIGFAAQFLCLSLVFAGVKNYRDKYQGGVIGFGKALYIGALIGIIACTMYVISWAVEYYLLLPDFTDRFTAYAVKQAHLAGPNSAQAKSQLAGVKMLKEWYSSPVKFVLITYMEILPSALIVTLITALILKRKNINKPIIIA